MQRKTLLHNGCSLSYAMVGAGPDVLLIQGTGVGGDAWQPQVEALSRDFRCLWFDNRGYGRSQPLGGPLSVEKMADDALAILAAEGIGAVHLVGHSLGGPIALAAAQQARRSGQPRVRSLSLLCTFASGRVPTRLEPRLVWLGLRSQLGTAAMRRRAFVEMVTPAAYLRSQGSAAVEQQLAAAFGRDLAEPQPVVMKQLAAMRAFDGTSLLSELRGVPSLVVSAGHDLLAPPSAGRELAEPLAARYVELADAGHAAPIQCSARINELLREHLMTAAA